MAKNDQNPFGSISISQNSGKNDLPQEDIDVSINQPADIEQQQKKIIVPPENPNLTHGTLSSNCRKGPPSSSLLITSAVIGSAVFIFLLYALLGFFGVPYFFQHVFPEKAEKLYHRAVTFGSVSYNPFTAKLRIRNMIIGPNTANPADQVDPLFSATFVESEISWLALVRGRLNCTSITADNLFLHLVRNTKQTYNIGDIVNAGKNNILPQINFPVPYFLQNITITNSRILFEDLPTEKKYNLEQLNLDLPLLFHDPQTDLAEHRSSTPGEGYINPRFTAIINGSPIELTGQTKLDGGTFEARLQLHFNAVDLPAYLAYLPQNKQLRLEKGAGDILMDLSFLSTPDGKVSLEVETSSHLTDIAVKDALNNTSIIPEATIRATVYPLLSRYNFKEISLSKPTLFLVRTVDDHWSFPFFLSDYADRTGEKDDNAKPEIIFTNIKVTDGKLNFVDQKIPGGFNEIFSDCNANLTNSGLYDSIPAMLSLSGITQDKGKFSLQANIRYSPLSLKGKISADGISLPKIARYFIPDSFRLTQGNIDNFESIINFESNGPDKFFLEQGTGKITHFILDSQEVNWLTIPSAELKFGMLNPQKMIVKDLFLTAEDSTILLHWDENNHFNWNFENDGERTSENKKGLQLFNASFASAKTTLHIKDASLPSPIDFTQTGVLIQASGLTTETDTLGNVHLETNEIGGGSCVLSGSVSFSPFSAKLSCSLNNYAVTTIPTLITDWLNLSKFSGRVDAEGNLKLPHLTYSGSVSIRDFKAGEENSEDQFAFTRADCALVDFSLNPFSLSTQEIVCDQAVLQMTNPGNGPLNVVSFFSRSRPGLSDFTNSGQITIPKISLSNATLVFTDKRYQPVYSSRLNINGTIENLVNKKEERMHLHLSSTQEQNSSGTFSGDLGFFDTSFLADFEISLFDMPLKEFSSYLQPLIGYKFEAGHFNLISEFHQDGKAINSNNTIKVVGLKLGETQGTLRSQLPLTVALLTDPEEKFELHIPIAATLTDSGYTFASTIGRSLQKIILKTSASPFAHLEAHFPELTQDHDHIFFKPGKADLTPENKKLIAAYAQVLNQRPLLALNIKGYADSVLDVKAIEAEKKEIARQKEILDEFQKSAKLSQKYGQEEINSPELQQNRGRSAQQPEDLTVSKNELLNLALQRQKIVKEFLSSSLGLSSMRVNEDFSGALVPVESVGRKGNRVDLRFGTF